MMAEPCIEDTLICVIAGPDGLMRIHLSVGDLHLTNQLLRDTFRVNFR